MVYSLEVEVKFYNVIGSTFNSSPVIIKKMIGFNIDNNLNNLTNTLVIKLPKHNAIIKRAGTNKYLGFNYYGFEDKSIGVGAKVELKYGYNISDKELGFDGEDIQFIGYVNDIEITDEHLVINIQDSMYLLKKAKKVVKTYSNTSLYDIIDDICNKLNDLKIKIVSNITFTFSNLKIGNLLLPSEVLNMLKDEYNFYFYFIGEVLYCGAKYPLGVEHTKEYQFEYPYNRSKYAIITKELSNTKSDIEETIVKMQSSQLDNSVVKVYATYDFPNGIQYSNDSELPIKDYLNTIEIKIPNTLVLDCQKLVKERLAQQNNNSVEGSITTFGKPFIHTGEIVNITIKELSDESTYVFFVDAVLISYANGGGITQTIQLGSQI